MKVLASTNISKTTSNHEWVISVNKINHKDVIVMIGFLGCLFDRETRDVSQIAIIVLSDDCKMMVFETNIIDCSVDEKGFSQLLSNGILMRDMKEVYFFHSLEKTSLLKYLSLNTSETVLAQIESKLVSIDSTLDTSMKGLSLTDLCKSCNLIPCSETFLAFGRAFDLTNVYRHVNMKEESVAKDDFTIPDLTDLA